MPLQSSPPADLFEVANDPDVILARRDYQASARAAQKASRGYKRKAQFKLQAALHTLLRAEMNAEKKLKEAGYVRPKAKPEIKPASPQRQSTFITRECGDDTNYRPLCRKS